MISSSHPQSVPENALQWLEPHRIAFLERLDAQGYAPGTVRIYTRITERFCAEARRLELTTCPLHAETVDAIRTAVLDGIIDSSRDKAAYPLKRFIEHLVAAGAAVASSFVTVPTAMDSLREEYDGYLRHQRGLSEATIYACMRFFERFMTFRFGETLGDLDTVTQDDIIAFLMQFRNGPETCRDKTPPTHLRNLFKFFFWSGKTKRNLAESMPRIAQPQPTSLPRYLSPEEVQQLIDAVRSDDAMGRRNYAMLLLMTRLGLRAPELVAIQLEDIDWRAGEILIRGKGKLHDRVVLKNCCFQRSASYKIERTIHFSYNI